MTMIATLGLTGHTSAGTIRARLDLDTWEVYVTHKLVPILKAGDVVIMDNLNLHKAAAARRRLLKRLKHGSSKPPY
jgi:hypothetical protein